MVQYLDLLRSNLSLEELQHIIPDVVQLLLDYGLNPEVAFWISRPTIAQRMVEADREDSEKKRAEGDVVKELTNGDIEMADQLNGVAEEDGEAVETENTPENAATPTPAEISGTALDSGVSDVQADSLPAEGGVKSVKWHPVLQEIMDAIRPKLPRQILDIVGVGFYVTFWQLSLYDITIPGKAYEDELSRQHKKMTSISTDRSDISVAGTRRKEAEKKNISELVDRLLKENKDHLKAFAESKARLQREKDQWFVGMSRRYEQLNSALMEYCFLPRILNSPLDSFFCFKFVKLLHSSGTPNFRTLGFYDLIFRVERLTSLIFSCTSKESDNLGRFLNEILRDLARWHKERTLYEREAYGSKRTLPGFTMQLDGEGKPVTFLSYEDYRRILYRWHGVVFSALQNCLSSSEYMHIRNAISVLRAISQHFPAINFHGTALQKTINNLSASDMADIVVSSKALIGMLARQEKSWVLPASFRKGQDKPTNGERDGSLDAVRAQAVPDTSGGKASNSAASAPSK
jgi:THO complex subunit 2